MNETMNIIEAIPVQETFGDIDADRLKELAALTFENGFNFDPQSGIYSIVKDGNFIAYSKDGTVLEINASEGTIEKRADYSRENIDVLLEREKFLSSDAYLSLTGDKEQVTADSNERPFYEPLTDNFLSILQAASEFIEIFDTRFKVGTGGIGAIKDSLDIYTAMQTLKDNQRLQQSAALSEIFEHAKTNDLLYLFPEFIKTLVRPEEYEKLKQQGNLKSIYEMSKISVYDENMRDRQSMYIFNTGIMEGSPDWGTILNKWNSFINTKFGTYEMKKDSAFLIKMQIYQRMGSRMLGNNSKAKVIFIPRINIKSGHTGKADWEKR